MSKKINMKNLADNLSNKRFFKVQEELKRLLSVVMYNIEEQEDGFDSIISNSSNPEDIEIAKKLNESNKKLDKYAQEYVQSIGTPSKPKQSKMSNNQKNVSTAKVNTISHISSNTHSKDLNINAIKGIDEDQR